MNSLGGAEVQVGIESDMRQGVDWMRKAAAKDFAPAQYQLSLCWRQGLGLEADAAKADEWLRKAANNGHEEAKEAADRACLTTASPQAADGGEGAHYESTDLEAQVTLLFSSFVYLSVTQV